MLKRKTFYNTVNVDMNSVPKHSVTIVLRDFDVKTDKRNYEQVNHWKGSLHKESNVNGIRLINLVIHHNLQISSTMLTIRSFIKEWCSDAILVWNVRCIVAVCHM